MINLKPFVNNKQMHDAFMAYLDDKIAQMGRALETAWEEKEIYRIQGDIRRLRKLKLIRDEINEPEVDDGSK